MHLISAPKKLLFFRQERPKPPENDASNFAPRSQQAAIEKLQQRMESAVEATTPEALLKAWMPMASTRLTGAGK